MVFLLEEVVTMYHEKAVYTILFLFQNK